MQRRNLSGYQQARSEIDVVLLVVGDRTPFDEVPYPDTVLHGRAGADGRFVFSRKDGAPHED